MGFIENLLSFLPENDYIYALIYLVVWFTIIRVGVFILEKIIIKLTTKTETDLDDLILEKSSKPLTYIAFLFGLKISIAQLVLTEAALKNINLAIISLVGIIAARLIYIIFDLSFSRVWKKAAKRAKTRPNEAMLQLIKGTLKVVLIFTGLLYLLSIWGVEIGPLLTGLGIGGLAIAFALQSSLANIFGGISIILDKTVNVGDLVNLSDGTSGKILRIGLRSTQVKTFDNELVIVPNSTLASENIHNVAQPEPKSRAVIPFGVAYGSDIAQVKKIVLQEIKKVKGIVDKDSAHVKFLEMADSSLNFKAYFLVETFENRLGAIDEANTKIYNALNKANIEIPFPQMDINLKK